jgi:hypothetical protein
MRSKPYKDPSRAKCTKCGAPGIAEWRICADGYYRVLCAQHDAELNAMVARWAFSPKEAKQKIKHYEQQRSA